MKEYIANAYLAHNGKNVKPGTIIELEAEQVERLGDKVILATPEAIEHFALEVEKQQQALEEMKGKPVTVKLSDREGAAKLATIMANGATFS